MPAATPSATGLFAPPPVQASTSQLRSRDLSSSGNDFEGQLRDAQQAQSTPAPRSGTSSSDAATDKAAPKAKSTAPASKRSAKAAAKKSQSRDGQADATDDAGTDTAAADSAQAPAATDSDTDPTAPQEDVNKTPGSGDSATDAAKLPSDGVPILISPNPQGQHVALPPHQVLGQKPTRIVSPAGSPVMTPYGTQAGGETAQGSGTEQTKQDATGAAAAADGTTGDASATAQAKAAAGQDLPTVSPLDADPDAAAEGVATPKTAAKTANAAQDTAQAAADAAGAVASLVTDSAPGPKPATSSADADGDAITSATLASTLATAQPSHHTGGSKGPDAAAPADATPLPNETQFAETNHANIVSDVRSALMPHGGTMQIRLDPPELGALQVSVEVKNGTVNATFQTSNDDATRLLSHSLGQLKTALEAQGVTVDKISVQQTPKDQKSNGDSSQQQQQSGSQARQEQQRDQQRREMLQRMWARVSGQPMPVDLVA